MPDPLDALDLSDGKRLAIFAGADGLAAVPMVRGADGRRRLVFAGSEWEAQLAEWTTERGSTVVGVGVSWPGTQYNLRYPGDADDTVRLLTEVLVPELIAARAWQAQRM